MAAHSIMLHKYLTDPWKASPALVSITRQGGVPASFIGVLCKRVDEHSLRSCFGHKRAAEPPIWITLNMQAQSVSTTQRLRMGAHSSMQHERV